MKRLTQSCEIDVKQLWLRFKNEKNQEMLKSFELFIENAAREIKKTKNENYHLESVLHRYILKLSETL